MKTQSVLILSITRGNRCDAEEIISEKATARSVMRAVKRIAAEYKNSGFDPYFAASMTIDGVHVNPDAVSYGSPTTTARSLIRECEIKAAHAAIA